MKADKTIFVDESLEKAFDGLDKEDPIKKALTKAIKDIKEETHC
jgi:hypothetical protein